ncbi:MAG: sigma 54-interacting transcriptional regulator [Desulfobacteraceae bacterium]|nr:sigma 54-interacting transcriptional regulator [Desulfobacteraceae bacterium]MBC2750016.1 sigma 54-interacting transcriptional regulator [Desulfobacteraceae bacterium]
MNEKILVVDDEESIRYTFQIFLEDEGFHVTTADSYDAALTHVKATDFDLIFLDIILDGQSGIDLLRSIRKYRPGVQVVMITGAPSVETASEALRLGALDYIVKPVRQDNLMRATTMAIRHKQMVDERESCRRNMEAIFRSIKDGIVTVTENMTVMEINEAAAGICGISQRSVSDKPIAAVLGDCGGDCLKALHQTLKTQKSAHLHHIECRARRRPGQVISVCVSPLLNRQNKFAGGVMVLRDETRLLNLERNLKERQFYDRLIGNSPGMQKVKSLIKDLASVPTTVLLTGESGTGKELVVDSLHFQGDRSDKALIKVNCSALSDNLLESELFGHVRGAFTGAIKDHVGRFQKADGGTIFLDEIGDISPKMQLRLLRVIENMEFQRVGGNTSIKVDVRIVAATNQDLRLKVARGQFREDLYYRLRVMEVKLPPLRERREDIPLLVSHFIQKFNRKLTKQIKTISEEALRGLTCHDWPGNVRELENVIERAFVLCHQSTITLEHLSDELTSKSRSPISGAFPIQEDEEVSSILSALDKTAGNKSRAARLLGLSRKTIYRKIEKYNLQV